MDGLEVHMQRHSETHRSSIHQQRQQNILTSCFFQGYSGYYGRQLAQIMQKQVAKKHVKLFLLHFMCPTLEGNILENSYVFFKIQNILQ